MTVLSNADQLAVIICTDVATPMNKLKPKASMSFWSFLISNCYYYIDINVNKSAHWSDVSLASSHMGLLSSFCAVYGLVSNTGYAGNLDVWKLCQWQIGSKQCNYTGGDHDLGPVRIILF